MVLRKVSRQRLARTLHGRELVRTRRHGKHLLVAVDEVGWLVLHFGMTGFLSFAQAGEPATGHPRLIVHLAGGRRMVYDDTRRLGFVTLTDDHERYVAQEHLGIDALEVTPTGLRDLLGSRRGALKPDRGADPERLPRAWLLPHRKDGARCPRGNGEIRKYRIAGRSAFYCPGCQS